MSHPPTPKARDLFTDQQIEQFLSLIRTGVGRALAAQRIGATGSLMRSLCRKQRDPWFAEQYELAVEEGEAFYADRLAAEARTRALAGSDRMLEVELATNGHPRYDHLRRDRVAISGRIEHEHALVLKLDPAVLDTWPVERLDSFRQMLVELEGEIVEGEARELPAGDAEAA